MHFRPFDRRPPLDETSRQWLIDTFVWALDNFDARLFFDYTQLVLPSNHYFPGRADSIEGIAHLILKRVKQYAGMSHWPTQVADQHVCAPLGKMQIVIQGPLRGEEVHFDQETAERQYLLIPYNPQQINNPEGMIASFAHILAHYLGQMAKEPPPGGVEYWPHATELLAVFLGFGLMFANSAFNFRGGCGSCYNPHANRDAYLSELEATYALAIFCVLKAIPTKRVTGHLKGHLKGVFKKMMKDAAQRPELLSLFIPSRQRGDSRC